MKKTALVLLATLSLLCLLFLVSCGKAGEQILASQPTETDSVSSLPTGSAAPETKQTEPAQTEPEQTEPEQPAVCAHVFGEWETVTEPTCESDGVRRRTCSLCGQTESETLLGGHSYGALFNEVPPTLFRDGTLAHYECSVCRKLFDEDKNEIATAAVPKRSSDLSICVNGTPTPLNLVEKNENSIVWSLSGLSVAKGDVITLCETGNAAVTFDYFASGNVDGETGKILTAAPSADVTLSATPNGLTLSVSGYRYEGVVIEINGEQYPMNHVQYFNSETNTYIYGWYEFQAGDRFVIIDHVNGVTYDFDDLSDDSAWDTWDYHRGENGEFVMDDSARYGVEFDRGGNGKIDLNKTFAPLDGNSYQVTFADAQSESVDMKQTVVPSGTEAYEEAVWYINHEKTVNGADISSYIEENGYCFYSATVSLEAGAMFQIRNVTANLTVGAEHLSAVYAAPNCVAVDGGYIKILADGEYTVLYLPSCNSISISAGQEPAATDGIVMYLDGNFIPLEKDADGCATYNNLAATTSTNVAFMSGSYTTLPLALDPDTQAGIAHVSSNLLFFDRAGTFHVKYNPETGAATLEIVSLEPVDVTYSYFLSVVDYTNGNQTPSMAKNPDNAKEVCVKGLTVAENSYLMVSEVESDNPSNSKQYASLADTDDSVAVSYGTLILVKAAGTYDVFFNTETKTVRIAATVQS